MVLIAGIPGTRSGGTRNAGASPYKRINSTPATPAKYNYSPFRVGIWNREPNFVYRTLNNVTQIHLKTTLNIDLLTAINCDDKCFQRQR